MSLYAAPRGFGRLEEHDRGNAPTSSQSVTDRSQSRNRLHPIIAACSTSVRACTKFDTTDSQLCSLSSVWQGAVRRGRLGPAISTCRTLATNLSCTQLATACQDRHTGWPTAAAAITAGCRADLSPMLAGSASLKRRSSAGCAGGAGAHPLFAPLIAVRAERETDHAGVRTSGRLHHAEDMPLPKSAQRALAKLRMDEIARLSTCGGY